MYDMGPPATSQNSRRATSKKITSKKHAAPKQYKNMIGSLNQNIIKIGQQETCTFYTFIRRRGKMSGLLPEEERWTVQRPPSQRQGQMSVFRKRLRNLRLC